MAIDRLIHSVQRGLESWTSEAISYSTHLFSNQGQTDHCLDTWVTADEELAQFGSFSSLISSPGLVYKSPTNGAQLDNEHSSDEESDDEQEA